MGSLTFMASFGILTGTCGLSSIVIACLCCCCVGLLLFVLCTTLRESLALTFRFLAVFRILFCLREKNHALYLRDTGPIEHLKSMLSADRLYFTFVYFGSMFMTLYFTFTIGGASGYLLVMSASGAQILALLYYLVSFLPGGAAGLQYVLSAVCQVLKPVVVACAHFQAMCLAKLMAVLWSRNSSASATTNSSTTGIS